MKKGDRDKIAVFTVLLLIVNSAGWLLIENKVLIISIPLLAMLILQIHFNWNDSCVSIPQYYCLQYEYTIDKTISH